MQGRLEELRAAGATVVAISADQPDKLRAYAQGDGIEFPFLVDADLDVMRRYGILNEEQRAVPHPTVIVVDERGVVRWFHTDADYRKRPPVDDILAVLRS